jgi:hypothetical protein
MRRVQTVSDLKELLEELPDDMPIMAQHQPNWPLREFIGGIWVDDPSDPSSQEEEENICPTCEHVSLGVPTKDSGGQWYRKCFKQNCGEEVPCEEPSEPIAYVVLNGQPYDSTPYGSKRAWGEL